MKRFLGISVVFMILLNISAFANKIDDLVSDKDVNDFVISINAEFAKNKNGRFRIRTTDSIAKDLNCDGVFLNWNIKNWEKVDITNDGLTDLVFLAYWYGYVSYALIDNGSDNFKLIRLSEGLSEECQFFKPIKTGSINYLKLFRKTQEEDFTIKTPFGYKEAIIIDTLVFKYDSFIELQRAANDDIQSIEINTSFCLGSCPSFTLKLYENGKADFEGIGFTKSTGKSSKILNKAIFKELSEMISSINIKKLRNSYTVPWTDSQTVTLTITFKDQSKKIIRDYGLRGTFGLKAIYSKLIPIGSQW